MNAQLADVKPIRGQVFVTYADYKKLKQIYKPVFMVRRLRKGIKKSN
jgi:uncharacterized protein (DUF486 family)